LLFVIDVPLCLFDCGNVCMQTVGRRLMNARATGIFRMRDSLFATPSLLGVVTQKLVFLT
jgi:hypothetical protein